jgi:NADH dehydrogenase
MERPKPLVVIVGGGFGGLHAALSLGRQPVDVTLVDRRNHHLFQPFLYQVATAGLSPSEIAQPIRHILARAPNVRVLLDEALSADLNHRRVALSGGSITYDYLILATGAGESYFGHEEWKSHAPGLKSIEDALEIRRRILTAFEIAEHETDERKRETLMTFVVVGGGPTGVEMAGALSEMAHRALTHEFRNIDPARARIVLVEADPHLLATFTGSSSRAAERRLKAMGVEVFSRTRVTRVGPDFVEADALRIKAGTIIWAAGVSGSPLARTLGVPLDKAGRILLQPDLSIPGHPEAFAIGDMALFLQDGKPLPGLAPVAMQMGRYVAKNILNRLRDKDSSAFHYHHKGTMTTIGRNAAVAEIGPLRFHGWVAWILWLVVHILFLIGFRNKVMVLMEWTWSYFTYNRGARLITKPPHAG